MTKTGGKALVNKPRQAHRDVAGLAQVRDFFGAEQQGQLTSIVDMAGRAMFEILEACCAKRGHQCGYFTCITAVFCWKGWAMCLVTQS